MAITKQKKEDIVAKVADALKDAASVVFVRFGKMTVADTTAMRKSLKGDSVGYMVVKKTLIKRALADKGYGGALPELEGEVALAWTKEDPTAPARGIHEFGKKHESLSILGGIFENAFIGAAEMKAIATIPPVPVLRGMFVNVINSPVQRFAIALSEVSKKKPA